MAWISTEIGNIYYGAQCAKSDIEIPDAPSPYHDWSGTDWVENTKKRTGAERNLAKQIRQAAVDAITVEVNGKVFDGDETSQTRMSRAILGMQETGQPTITWVLADNTVTQATHAELTEALCMAGARQAELWVIA